MDRVLDDTDPKRGYRLQEVKMSTFVNSLMAEVKAKNPSEPEFYQAVEEVAMSLELVLEKHMEYRAAKILERIMTQSVLNDDFILISNFNYKLVLKTDRN